MDNVIWAISNLDRRVSDGFVTMAHWQAIATDGPHSVRIYATCSWADGYPAVPYEQLTEPQVLSWVWVQVDKAAIEADARSQLATLKNPMHASGLPWAA